MPKYLQRAGAGGGVLCRFQSLPGASARYGSLRRLDVAGMRWTDFLIMPFI